MINKRISHAEVRSNFAIRVKYRRAPLFLFRKRTIRSHRPAALCISGKSHDEQICSIVLSKLVMLNFSVPRVCARRDFGVARGGPWGSLFFSHRGMRTANGLNLNSMAFGSENMLLANDSSWLAVLVQK